jgi:ligand-binding SRPBCC domain-containing protein
VSAIELRFRSHVAAPAPEVWAVVSTMDGVNAELRPFVRMTHPAHLQSLADTEIQPGAVVLHSWLLAGGILPFDRHALALERVLDGEGFDEESTSWMQRRWRHERRLDDHGDGTCTVSDHLIVQPRLGFLRPVAARVVRFLFAHRHRRLVQRFGAARPPLTS